MVPFDFQIEFKPVTGFRTPTHATVQVAPGLTNLVNRRYESTTSSTNVAIRPSLGLSLAGGLRITGGLGTTYRVEYVPALTNATPWTLLQSITLTNATQAIPGTLPAAQGARFDRAVVVEP